MSSVASILDENQWTVVTWNDLFTGVTANLSVEDGADDSLQSANLRSNAQGQKHQKEDDGPKGGRWQFHNGLCEDNENQSRPFHRLGPFR